MLRLSNKYKDEINVLRSEINKCKEEKIMLMVVLILLLLGEVIEYRERVGEFIY